MIAKQITSLLMNEIRFTQLCFHLKNLQRLVVLIWDAAVQTSRFIKSMIYTCNKTAYIQDIFHAVET